MNEANDTLFAEVPSREEVKKARKAATDKAYYERNKEKYSASSKAWREAHKDEFSSYIKAYRIANKDKISAKNKELYEATKEIRRAYYKKWREENQDIRAEHQRNRRAMKKNSVGQHTKEDIMNLFMLQKNKCACCRKSIKNEYHADHIVPLSKGGSNDKYNIQLLCAPCNLRKNAKDPIEFNQSLGLLL